MTRSEIDKWQRKLNFEDLWYFIRYGNVSETPVPLALVPNDATHVLNTDDGEAENPQWIELSGQSIPPLSTSKPLSPICILSAIAAILGFFPLIFFGGVAGIILGIFGLKHVKKSENHYRGRGWAITGVVLGCVVVLSWGIFFLISQTIHEYEGESSYMQNNLQASAIEVVIEQKIRILDEYDSIPDIPRHMRRISLAGTPTDFREAFGSHIRAWDAMAEVHRHANAVQRHYSSDDAFAEDFIRGLMGDPFGKANEQLFEEQWIRERFEVALSEIERTYAQLERVAAWHGANIPGVP